jgi:hypothetical protein
MVRAIIKARHARDLLYKLLDRRFIGSGAETGLLN